MIGRLAPPWDRLLLDARLATLRDDLGAYGVIESAALAWKDGLVAFAGPASELPGEAAALAARRKARHPTALKRKTSISTKSAARAFSTSPPASSASWPCLPWR